MLFFQALGLLVIYDLLNIFCRFETICTLVRRWTISNRRVDQEAIERVCAAVDRACVWYPKHALCFQRSFVITYLLRKSGVPANLVIGAQNLPFRAHAWVEVLGRTLNERADTDTTYAVWERC